MSPRMGCTQPASSHTQRSVGWPKSWKWTCVSTNGGRSLICLPSGEDVLVDRVLAGRRRQPRPRRAPRRPIRAPRASTASISASRRDAPGRERFAVADDRVDRLALPARLGRVVAAGRERGVPLPAHRLALDERTGPRPARARSTARPIASATAVTSLPSTISAVIPKPRSRDRRCPAWPGSARGRDADGHAVVLAHEDQRQRPQLRHVQVSKNSPSQDAPSPK